MKLELSEDVQDWKTKLTGDEKEFITQVLRLFTQSDVQVGENYHELLIPKFRNNEVRNMLAPLQVEKQYTNVRMPFLMTRLVFRTKSITSFLSTKRWQTKSTS